MGMTKKNAAHLSLSLLVLFAVSIPNIARSDTPEVDAFLRARPRLSNDQRKFLKHYIGKYLGSTLTRAARDQAAKLRGDTLGNLRKNDEKLKIFEDLYSVRSNLPNGTNWPGFTNSSGYLSEVISLSEGACFGVTEFIRRMNLLAVYDPNNLSGATVPPRTDPKAYFGFYEKLFEQIGKNEVAVFPGFKNMIELSGDSLIRRAMKERAVIFWAEKNARLSVFFQMWKAPNFKVRKAEMNRLHKKLKSRIALHYNPVIFIAKPIKEWIHVLQVASVTEKAADGSWSATIWDPNVSSGTRTLRVSADGSASYGGELTEAEIAPKDDFEVGQIAGSLSRFCEKNAQLCDLQKHP